MREIRLLVTQQVRLFHPDIIPILRLFMPDSGKKVQSLFDFQAVEPIQEEGGVTGIAFTGGLYKPNSAVIEKAVIEPRRISLKMLGDTKTATTVYREIKLQLQELNGGRPIEEILCTHETATSIVLNFSFERILSTQFVSFLNSALAYTKNQWSESFIIPVNLKFAVRYKLTDDGLLKDNVTLLSKELVIEPRAQSSTDERLYWITSPTDTDTHLKLIEELEKALG